MLEAVTLREVLHYDPITGLFTRRKKTSNRVKIGERAGTLNRLGYRQIRACGALEYEHRLAWLYMTGSFPIGDVDHINGVRGDNRFSNLRDATRQTNLENQRRASKNSQVGLLGVTRYKEKFRATITANRRHIFLGTFRSAEEAHEAYLRAKRKIHAGSTL